MRHRNRKKHESSTHAHWSECLITFPITELMMTQKPKEGCKEESKKAKLNLRDSVILIAINEGSCRWKLYSNNSLNQFLVIFEDSENVHFVIIKKLLFYLNWFLLCLLEFFISFLIEARTLTKHFKTFIIKNHDPLVPSKWGSKKSENYQTFRN